MEIRGIKYVGPIFDVSGYGQAARGYALSLHKLGIPLTIDSVSFEEGLADFGETSRILAPLVDKNIDYNIVIIHLTANLFCSKAEPGKMNIGYFVWETDKVHEEWVEEANKSVSFVMTASQWGADIFRKSGITVPVAAIPHGIDADEFVDVDPYTVAGVKQNAYKFYGIFQFTERKHPMALIKSYWSAFQNNENVALILKTYRNGFADSEKEAIRATIKRLKKVTNMPIYPPIYLISERLDRSELLGLHKTCDCLVHLDRGEGFGLVPFEAGVCGNPILITGWGGALEYAKEDNSYLVNYTLTPVFGMPWSPWYSGNQLWAEPDCGHAIELLREIYNNQGEARIRGEKLKQYIIDNFSWENVGSKIIETIKSL